jgi:hypothetical protein
MIDIVEILIRWCARWSQNELATSLGRTTKRGANIPRRPVTLYYCGNPWRGTSLATSDGDDRWSGELARPFA